MMVMMMEVIPLRCFRYERKLQTRLRAYWKSWTVSLASKAAYCTQDYQWF